MNMERRRQNADDRRMERWARINAAIGFGALALFVVMIIMIVHALVAR